MTTLSSEQAIWLIALAGLFVLWLVLIGRQEEPTPCYMACFRHGRRPRFHVPCSRCIDRHPHG